MNTTSSFSRSVFKHWGFLWVPCALALLLLWLPFGFSIMGLLEEWDVLAVFTRLDGPLLWVTSETPLAAHRMRPLTIAPHSIAYLLNPDSFFYWHVLLIASLLLKGAAGSLIGWWLTRSRRWAAVLGLLVVFYPADTMQLSFRSFHIDWAVTLGLLAAALCAYAFTAVNSAWRVLATSIAVVCAMTATFAYEAMLTYAAIPFLLLYARFGWRGSLEILRTRRWVAVAWVAAAVCSVLYMLVAIRSGDTYQATLVNGAADAPGLYARLVRLLQVGYGRTLVGGWLDAIAIVRYEYRSVMYLLVVAIAGIWVVRRFSRPATRDVAFSALEANAPAASPRRMVLVGLAIILLGYAPFLSSIPHLMISQRTYLGATPGAALLVLAVLIAVTRPARGLGMALAVVALLLGFAAQLFQFEHYRRLSVQQQTILADIVGNMPPPTLDKTLVIIDEREQINDVWMLRNAMVMSLLYLYDREINPPVICSPGNNVWQKVNALDRVGTCVETDEGWQLTESPMPDGAPAVPSRLLKRSDAVVVVLAADGSVQSSVDDPTYRQMLLHGDAPMARRFRNILERPEWPLQLDLFRSPVGGESFHWDFGRWWSMEQPVRGAGWLSGGWTTYDNAMPVWHSVAWINRPLATMQFPLMPKASPYKLAVRVGHLVPPASPESVQVSINGHPLQLEWNGVSGFTASVDLQWLRLGGNELQIVTPETQDPSQLSMLVDWVALTPTK